MPFITIPVGHREYQLTFDDILNGINKSFFEAREKEQQQGNTRTVYRPTTPQRLLDVYDFKPMLKVLNEFNQKYKHLIDTTDKSSLYYSFKIPKRSGGLRQIDAPNDQLKFALRELKYIFEVEFRALHHTTAFAYVARRSTIDAIKRHQDNKSRWFLKLDFSNFFGSTTLDFVIKQLEMIFPFSEVMLLQGGKEALKTALSLAFLKGGLPQGTPISPTITNIMMVPIDHHIAKVMRDFTPHIVYTRYADDLLLSADLSFKWSEVQEKVLEILHKYGAPFTIKKEKTRYGSSAGRNWNLGVMLNKDNQITIGNQKKKVFKAMLHSLHTDYRNGVFWSLSDIQEFQGLMSYYLMVEKDNIQKIVNSYDEKYKIKTSKIVKATMNNPGAA